MASWMKCPFPLLLFTKPFFLTVTKEILLYNADQIMLLSGLNPVDVFQFALRINKKKNLIITAYK